MQIRERRKELNLKQDELAARLDPPVTQPAVSAWERGKEAVPVDRIEDLARALEWSVDQLLGEREYVITEDDFKVRWRDAVQNDQSLSGDAQVVLLWVGLLADISEKGEPAEYSGSIERVARALRAFELEEVRACWEEVVESPYVERYTDAEWVLRLTIPRVH